MFELRRPAGHRLALRTQFSQLALLHKFADQVFDLSGRLALDRGVIVQIPLHDKLAVAKDVHMMTVVANPTDE